MRPAPALRQLHLVRCGGTIWSSRPLHLLQAPAHISKAQIAYKPLHRTVSSTAPFKMSYSNADTGNKHPDPYKEKNKDDGASLKEKVDDLVAFMDSCKFAMMTTRIAKTDMLTSRCMALAAKESGGIDLLFHTNTESGKTDDLASDPTINIAFLDSSGQWASIAGNASISADREVVRKYYSPALKAWIGDLGDGIHDGGPEDPRIGVISVKARTITYAVTSKSFVGRGVEIAKGVATGSAPDINKLRELSEEDLAEWRKVNT